MTLTLLFLKNFDLIFEFLLLYIIIVSIILHLMSYGLIFLGSGL